MRLQITTGFAAMVAVGMAFAAGSASAQQAPLSPGGISTAADSFGGPGYTAPLAPAPRVRSRRQASVVSYSTTRTDGSPLSPGGIGTAANSFGGPGYAAAVAMQVQPQSQRRGRPQRHLALLNSANLTYTTTTPQGAPLSPGGIGTAADSFGGPGYQGP